MKEQELRDRFEAVCWERAKNTYRQHTDLFRRRGDFYEDGITQGEWEMYLAASTPLLERIAQMEKDAARYKWLRSSQSDFGVTMCKIDYWSDEYSYLAKVDWLEPHEYDKAIDTAIENYKALNDNFDDTALQHKEQT